MGIRPFDRWLPSLWKRYAQLFKLPFSVERRLGALFLLDRANAVDRNLLIKGAWEPRQLKHFPQLVTKHRRPGQRAVFLDVGAHGGLYSILFAKAGLFDEFIAFEPDPVNVAQLWGNLFLNGMAEAIHVVRAAASDKAGPIAFYISDNARRGGSRMGEAGESDWVRTVEVEAVVLDDTVQAAECLVAAKIDVEGYELRVLAGMTRVLAENDCVLQIESFSDKAPALIEWMAERGYELTGKIVHDHYFERSISWQRADDRSDGVRQ